MKVQWYRGRRYYSLFYRLCRDEKLRKLEKIALIVIISSILAGSIIVLFYDRIAGAIFMVIIPIVAIIALFIASSSPRYRRKTGACFFLLGSILLGLVIFISIIILFPSGYIIESLRYIIELLFPEFPELKLNINNVLRPIALSVLAVTLIIFGLFLSDP